MLHNTIINKLQLLLEFFRLILSRIDQFDKIQTDIKIPVCKFSHYMAFAGL